MCSATTHVVPLYTLEKEIRPCAGEVFYRVNRFCVFTSYHIFAHLACPCMALFLGTLALLHVRSIMLEDLCPFLSKKKNLN